MSCRVSPAPTTESPLWMATERVQVHIWKLTVEDVNLILRPTRSEIYLNIRGVPFLTSTSGETSSEFSLWEVKRD